MRISCGLCNISTLLTLSSIVSAVTLDCEHVRAGGVDFNLLPLAGFHPAIRLEELDNGNIRNTTFWINLCRGFGFKSDNNNTRVPRNICPSGTRVCAVQRYYTPDQKGQPDPVDVWPVAGEFTIDNGRHLDPSVSRLRDSESNADADKEGLRIELNGGMHTEDSKQVRQKALIELICPREQTGLDKNKEDEAEEAQVDFQDDRDNYDVEVDDGEDGGHGDKGDDEDRPKKNYGHGSLDVVSYRMERSSSKSDSPDVHVLRVRWQTYHACEDQKDRDKDPPKKDNGRTSKHWGFFTWFIIVLFLALAAYLIFAAFLNYSRYGARGWDLLPHADTVRDVPYMLKDWGRRVVNTFQGSGSRGGYSAVR